MNYIYLLRFFILSLIFISCSESDNSNFDYEDFIEEPTKTYADINFSNWKLTLPVDEDNNGSPDEYQPSALINNGYRTLNAVKPYMFDNTSDGSLVFYTFPSSSTTNSKYSRTELRELINPEDAKENWTLKNGGEIKGRLRVHSISENTNTDDTSFHKVIVMQIHGIISKEDVEKYKFSSNNGPPLIKIYWKDGYVWSHKKILADNSTTGDDLIQPYTSSNKFWTDKKNNLGYVGYNAFDISINANNERIEVKLNEENPVTYSDLSLTKWRYENYFKAGNYLGTTDLNAFSYIKYYSLTVKH